MLWFRSLLWDGLGWEGLEVVADGLGACLSEPCDEVVGEADLVLLHGKVRLGSRRAVLLSL